jgi:hypothetical protein
MLPVRSKSKSDLKLHLTTEHYLHYWKVRELQLRAYHLFSLRRVILVGLWYWNIFTALFFVVIFGLFILLTW